MIVCAFWCWISLDVVKKLAEIGAYLGALGFFIYKARAGYNIVNVAISVHVDRRGRNKDSDDLAIAITVRKGGHGSLKVHDARVRITWPSGEVELPLIGIERLSFATDSDGAQRHRVTMNRVSKSNPYLHITPDEEATFSCATTIPRSAVCVVEAAVLGSSVFWHSVGQWRSSVIALPSISADANPMMSV
jgi:hypothetical protein